MRQCELQFTLCISPTVSRAALSRARTIFPSPFLSISLKMSFSFLPDSKYLFNVLPSLDVSESKEPTIFSNSSVFARLVAMSSSSLSRVSNSAFLFPFFEVLPPSFALLPASSSRLDFFALLPAPLGVSLVVPAALGVALGVSTFPEALLGLPPSSFLPMGARTGGISKAVTASTTGDKNREIGGPPNFLGKTGKTQVLKEDEEKLAQIVLIGFGARQLRINQSGFLVVIQIQDRHKVPGPTALYSIRASKQARLYMREIVRCVGEYIRIFLQLYPHGAGARRARARGHAPTCVPGYTHTPVDHAVDVGKRIGFVHLRGLQR